MYELRPTTRYRRDVRRLAKRGFDLELLHRAQNLLVQHGELPSAYKPHRLKGEYLDYIDVHIKDDWVLIYQLVDDNFIVLRRTGTHQDVFSKY